MRILRYRTDPCFSKKKNSDFAPFLKRRSPYNETFTKGTLRVQTLWVDFAEVWIFHCFLRSGTDAFASFLEKKMTSSFSRNGFYFVKETFPGPTLLTLRQKEQQLIRRK
jgi:hypothetical protein